MAERISPADLIAMNVFAGSEPVRIDLVYADAGHPENIFGVAAYAPDAPLILHKDMARLVLKAARVLNGRHGWTLVLKDGLRPVEAQAKLIDTNIVRANPHWLEEPRLLSGPGMGAHPRGMAIDVSVDDSAGQAVDMGTPFDGMVMESARGYQGLAADILRNRRWLEDGFQAAANALSLPLYPLPSEWWDFRFPAEMVRAYDALSDCELPEALKMGVAGERSCPDQARLAKDLLASL